MEFVTKSKKQTLEVGDVVECNIDTEKFYYLVIGGRTMRTGNGERREVDNDHLINLSKMRWTGEYESLEELQSVFEENKLYPFPSIEQYRVIKNKNIELREI